VEIALTGAGSLTASGETKEADITLSGAGSVDAKNLHAVNAKVNSTGVGSVEIYVTGQLDAKTASGQVEQAEIKADVIGAIGVLDAIRAVDARRSSSPLLLISCNSDPFIFRPPRNRLQQVLS
jgi:hypothetical protein